MFALTTGAAYKFEDVVGELEEGGFIPENTMPSELSRAPKKLEPEQQAE